MRVKELMTTAPLACGVGALANEAARIMWDCDCGSVPIVDAHGRAVGIVTDRDICMAAYFQGLPLSAIRIASFMSRDLCTVAPEDDVAAAEAVMRERQVKRLPVVAEDGTLVGILSLSDVSQAIATTASSRQMSGDAEELLRTVTKISEPRALAHAAG